MGWETHPPTSERFEDFADVVDPNTRTTHCWCLSHRISPKDIDRLGEGGREQAMRRLAAGSPAPRVITYHDGEPVGWCAISPAMPSRAWWHPS